MKIKEIWARARPRVACWDRWCPKVVRRVCSGSKVGEAKQRHFEEVWIEDKK